jgi:hypothetical protein
MKVRYPGVYYFEPLYGAAQVVEQRLVAFPFLYDPIKYFGEEQCNRVFNGIAVQLD